MMDHIYESGEDYLEAIYVIGLSKDTVRAIDIVHHLDYSKPSVSRALARLKEQKYIEIKQNLITLTPVGLKIGKSIYDRHQVFTEFLTHIGVDPDQAAVDACRMEHAVSEETFNLFKSYVLKTICNSKELEQS